MLHEIGIVVSSVVVDLTTAGLLIETCSVISFRGFSVMR